MPRRPSPTAACPCGLGAPYGECCGPLHAGRAAAPTAERLMRSRYSAFAVQDEDYLLRTWAAAARPPAVDLDPGVRWTGLDILGSTGGTAFHAEGTVDFRARFRRARARRASSARTAASYGRTAAGCTPERPGERTAGSIPRSGPPSPGGCWTSWPSRVPAAGRRCAGRSRPAPPTSTATSTSPGWCPRARFGECVDRAAQILARVRPLLSLRGDPESADADGRRLLFAAFDGLPLFWRLDLDVSAAPGGPATAPTVRHPWPPAASALANAVAAVKALHRGDQDTAAGTAAAGLAARGPPGPAHRRLGGRPRRARRAATALDPAQAPLARRLPPPP